MDDALLVRVGQRAPQFRQDANRVLDREPPLAPQAVPLLQGEITREQFDLLAVAINTGTNIPSIATPNGQAAFLFLLTSALAPLIRLSYFRMVWMALPYLATMTAAAVYGVLYLL